MWLPNIVEQGALAHGSRLHRLDEGGELLDRFEVAGRDDVQVSLQALVMGVGVYAAEAGCEHQGANARTLS